MKGKNSAEKLMEGILKLGPLEFLGICKIVGVDIFEFATEGEETPREFVDIWVDLCDAVEKMNRTRRRNLGKLIYSAMEKEE